MVFLTFFLLNVSSFEQSPSSDNSNLIDSQEIRSFKPIDFMTSPQTLMDVWIEEPIPLEQYSDKEKEIQKQINDKTTDGIITYAPLNGTKDYLDIDYEEITPYTWKWVKLEVTKPDGSESIISLRRPNWWIKQSGAEKVGNKVNLFLPEMGVKGIATIINISPNQLDTRLWDENREGDYVSRPITGKFEHKSNDVWNYYFEGLEEPIKATSSHPFWSIDRSKWVAVGELKIGEKVRAQHKTTKLHSKNKLNGYKTVYNIEVFKEHNYLVSEDAILVHNGCSFLSKKADDFTRLHSDDVITNSSHYDDIKKLSDEDLIQSVTNPRDGNFVTVNTQTGNVVEGNTRVYEIQRRGLDVDIPYQEYTPNNSDYFFDM